MDCLMCHRIIPGSFGGAGEAWCQTHNAPHDQDGMCLVGRARAAAREEIADVLRRVERLEQQMVPTVWTNTPNAQP